MLSFLNPSSMGQHRHLGETMSPPSTSCQIPLFLRPTHQSTIFPSKGPHDASFTQLCVFCKLAVANAR